MTQRLMLAVLGLVLLLGTAGGMVWAQTGSAGNLTGTIQQVSNDRLTLLTSGHSVSLAITGETVIRVGDKTVMAGDLKPGMSALVVAADGKTATEIRAYTPRTTTTTSPPATQNALTGVILQVGGGQLTLQATNHTIAITLTSATVIKVDGKVVGPGDLKTGMSAMVFAADGKTATEIRAYTPHTTTSQPATAPTNGQTGTITQIGAGQLTLQASSHTLVFSLSSTTVFKVDGKVVGQGDVKAGMSAIVFATEGKATEVRAYSPHSTTTSQPSTQPATQPITSGQSGIISQLSNDRLGVQTSAHVLSFAVTPTTPIKIDGHAAAIGDLKLGMSVLVFSADGKTATEIRAYTPHATQPTTQPTTQPPAPNGQTGTITQVEAGQLTLQASSHTLVYALTSSTILKMDGKIVGAGDIKSGSMAIVFSTDGTTAAEVRAYTPPAK